MCGLSAILQDIAKDAVKTETSQGVALLFVCWAWLVTKGKSEGTMSRHALLTVPAQNALI